MMVMIFYIVWFDFDADDFEVNDNFEVYHDFEVYNDFEAFKDF